VTTNKSAERKWYAVFIVPQNEKSGGLSKTRFRLYFVESAPDYEVYSVRRGSSWPEMRAGRKSFSDFRRNEEPFLKEQDEARRKRCQED